MEKSKASWQLRRALKHRSRRWRRRQVVGFYGLLLIYLLVTLGGDHHRFRDLWWAVYGLWIALVNLRQWSRGEPLAVTGLDDRAQLAHGLNFDQLTAAEQKEILSRYRVGTVFVNRVPDERQEALRLRANEAAFRFLRVALLCFAAGYWMVYLWVPAGPWRETLMDSPVVISWLVVFVISLPQMIVMWTEPDEVGEPRAMDTATQTS